MHHAKGCRLHQPGAKNNAQTTQRFEKIRRGMILGAVVGLIVGLVLGMIWLMPFGVAGGLIIGLLFTSYLAYSNEP